MADTKRRIKKLKEIKKSNNRTEGCVTVNCHAGAYGVCQPEDLDHGKK